jgi:hypothetical protein
MDLILTKCNATGKKRFPNPGSAKQALLVIKSKNRIINHDTNKRQKHRNGKAAQCRYYLCQHCKGYHLTSDAAGRNQTRIQKRHKQRVKNTQGLVITHEEAGPWKADSIPFPTQSKLK